MLFSQLLWPVFALSKSFSSQLFITNVRIVLLTLVFQLLRKLLFSPLLLRKLLFSPLEGKTLVFFTLWFSWLFLKYPSSPDWDYTRRETCRWTWVSLLYEKNIPRFKFPPLPNWRRRGFEPGTFWLLNRCLSQLIYRGLVENLMVRESIYLTKSPNQKH